jgi:DNA (cytosine-5)-methyltransferase 1
MSKLEFTFAGAFPKDYNFLNIDIQYLIGMSVPPVMTAQIATEIYNQWLSKI